MSFLSRCAVVVTVGANVGLPVGQTLPRFVPPTPPLAAYAAPLLRGTTGPHSPTCTAARSRQCGRNRLQRPGWARETLARSDSSTPRARPLLSAPASPLLSPSVPQRVYSAPRSNAVCSREGWRTHRRVSAFMVPISVGSGPAKLLPGTILHHPHTAALSPRPDTYSDEKVASREIRDLALWS
jgi:hypothetical protein